MESLINLPADAARADFAPFVADGEINGGHIAETLNGSKHVVGAPGQFQIGSIVVKFERVLTGGRRSSAHAGWRKVVTGYTITSTGEQYTKDGETLVNYYVSGRA